MYGTEPKFNPVVTQKPDMISRRRLLQRQLGGFGCGAPASRSCTRTSAVQLTSCLTCAAFPVDLAGMIGWDFGPGDFNRPWRGTIGATAGGVRLPVTPRTSLSTAPRSSTIGVARRSGRRRAGVKPRLLRLQLIATVGYHRCSRALSRWPSTSPATPSTLRRTASHLLQAPASNPTQRDLAAGRPPAAVPRSRGRPPPCQRPCAPCRQHEYLRAKGGLLPAALSRPRPPTMGCVVFHPPRALPSARGLAGRVVVLMSPLPPTGLGLCLSGSPASS